MTKPDLDTQINHWENLKRLAMLQKLSPESVTGITDEMIEAARAYPLEALLGESKRGFVLCPFHKEKTPSMWVKGNYAHCFGCGWSGDAIAVCMELEHLKFPEAVRKLTQ